MNKGGGYVLHRHSVLQNSGNYGDPDIMAITGTEQKFTPYPGVKFGGVQYGKIIRSTDGNFRLEESLEKVTAHTPTSTATTPKVTPTKPGEKPSLLSAEHVNTAVQRRLFP